ncbi:DedA family protein [Paenibacillus kyungheensis]|uniref:DedA family protein n=1 Tax=Paenibacillus kyungheensis TaxID=1452732 RepID=A0AAX3M3R2_9BACL|nr:DedA family protein [Paenibacillus kyungheensis]WCT56528.1 DedA family protein [Paenibacillus kyungheensis]
MQFIHYIESLFTHHSYLVLFLGLLLEFIALPFPGETMMGYAGYLSYMGRLNIVLLFLCAFAGTTIGMTITYFIGRKAGLPFLRKYGKWLLLPQSKLDKAQLWFGKYGYTLVFFGYFIPGVRHFTGYFSGVMNFKFWRFAAYSYSGALIWVSIFLALGRIFGPQWTMVFHWIHHYSFEAIAIIVVLILFFILVKFRRRLGIALVNRFGKKKPDDSAGE